MEKKRIVIASDSFKGTLSSLEICHLFQNEIKNREDIEAIYLPIADGGEGSLDAISHILEGRYIDIEVYNLYLNKMKTRFFVDKHDNAYIETASCAGLTIAREENDPGMVSTFGLGQQIVKAVQLGYKKIYVFLGGSATNDGGVGLAIGMGAKFFNKSKEQFIPAGLTLKEISRIDNSKPQALLKGINVYALCDVKSPFYGKEGAAYKFARQKGADEDEIKELDDGLKYLAKIINRDLGVDVSKIEGAGAAGGLGGGLFTFANAKICSGINSILDLIKFENQILNSDIVISGEGKLDRQTLDGKVIDGVAKRCLKMNKPLALIVGISELSLKEVQKVYPCAKYLFETNEKHLPFEEVKASSRKDYTHQIKKLLSNI